MTEAESATLMPTAEVTRKETKPENAPALSVKGDDYLVAGPIPFRYMAPPLSMDSGTARGSLMRVFKPHPDQSVLLSPHLKHSRFWELSRYRVTLTPVANKLNTSGRICIYYVANPYTAVSLTDDHELQRAMTAERRWEMDCQTELAIDLDLSGRLMNCCITPELFFSQLGCLRVTCLTPPQSDACPTWQVVIEGVGNFYGIDSFDNRLFRSEPIFDLSLLVEQNVLTVDLQKDSKLKAGQMKRYDVAIPVSFSLRSPFSLAPGIAADVQLSRRINITYTPHRAFDNKDVAEPGSVLSSVSTRVFNLVTQQLRYTTARLLVGSISHWCTKDQVKIESNQTFEELKSKLPLYPVYKGHLHITYESPDRVTAEISMPTQEARLIMSGPWIVT